MNRLLKLLIPRHFNQFRTERLQLAQWSKRKYLGHSPQFIKQNVFLEYGIPESQWIETGTYLGDTTEFLLTHFHDVHSVEPSEELYLGAQKRFQNKNVKLYNDVSENVLPNLLPKLSGNINFWLDGHYSSGVTFKGSTDCPVEDELAAIKANLANFDKVSILIDDVRCFLATCNNYTDYPSIDYLVDWARSNEFKWRIEHDIFIMQNY